MWGWGKVCFGILEERLLKSIFEDINYNWGEVGVFVLWRFWGILGDFCLVIYMKNPALRRGF